MNRTKWIESLKPKDSAVHVWHDLTMELVTIIELKKHCNETLAKVILKKQEYLFAYQINVDALFESTENIIYEIELKKKTDRLENCMWRNVTDDKINAVYDIIFDGSRDNNLKIVE